MTQSDRIRELLETGEYSISEIAVMLQEEGFERCRYQTVYQIWMKEFGNTLPSKRQNSGKRSKADKAAIISQAYNSILPRPIPPIIPKALGVKDNIPAGRLISAADDLNDAAFEESLNQVLSIKEWLSKVARIDLDRPYSEAARQTIFGALYNLEISHKHTAGDNLKEHSNRERAFERTTDITKREELEQEAKDNAGLRFILDASKKDAKQS